MSTEDRKKLPKSAFALPGKRKYPIHDKSHARDALARVSKSGTAKQQDKVRAAVEKRYPSMKKRVAKHLSLRHPIKGKR